MEKPPHAQLSAPLSATMRSTLQSRKSAESSIHETKDKRMLKNFIRSADAPIASNEAAEPAMRVTPADRLRLSIGRISPSAAEKLAVKIAGIEAARARYLQFENDKKELDFMIAIARATLNTVFGDERVELEDRLRSAETQSRNMATEANNAVEKILDDAGLRYGEIGRFVEGRA